MDYASQLYLSKAINSLREEHKGDRLVTILRMRFWENATYADISEAIGISKDRARQLDGRAVRLLRKKLRNTQLADYLA